MTKRLPDNKIIYIECPGCADRSRGVVFLQVKTRRDNKEQFLGCTNYPRCRHTEEIPESLRMTLEGHPDMFAWLKPPKDIEK